MSDEQKRLEELQKQIAVLERKRETLKEATAEANELHQTYVKNTEQLIKQNDWIGMSAQALEAETAQMTALAAELANEVKLLEKKKQVNGSLSAEHEAQ